MATKGLQTTGFPSPAGDHAQDRISLDQLAGLNLSSVFMYQVEGYGMTGAHIPNGSYLVVNRAKKPVNGSIVIAVHEGGGYIVRRLQINGTSRQLVAEHPKYKPIICNEDNPLNVWGVVTHIFIDAKEV